MLGCAMFGFDDDAAFPGWRALLPDARHRPARSPPARDTVVSAQAAFAAAIGRHRPDQLSAVPVALAAAVVRAHRCRRRSDTRGCARHWSRAASRWLGRPTRWSKRRSASACVATLAVTVLSLLDGRHRDRRRGPAARRRLSFARRRAGAPLCRLSLRLPGGRARRPLFPGRRRPARRVSGGLPRSAAGAGASAGRAVGRFACGDALSGIARAGRRHRHRRRAARRAVHAQRLPAVSRGRLRPVPAQQWRGAARRSRARGRTMWSCSRTGTTASSTAAPRCCASSSRPSSRCGGWACRGSS